MAGAAPVGVGAQHLRRADEPGARGQKYHAARARAGQLPALHRLPAGAARGRGQ